MTRHLMIALVLVASAATGCTGDFNDPAQHEDNEASADELAETPYYGCWSSTSWSATTTNGTTSSPGPYVSASRQALYGGRTAKVRERTTGADGHTHSIDFYSSYTGTRTSTYGYAKIACINDLTGNTYYVYPSHYTSGTSNPGCNNGDDTVIYARVKVYYATCA